MSKISPPSNKYIIVRGREAQIQLAMKLAQAEVWFQITPKPFDRYRVEVKSDVAHLLPMPRDWENDATDKELLDHAQVYLPEEFHDFKTGEAIWRDDATVAWRCADGFTIRTDVWVDYPKDTA